MPTHPYIHFQGTCADALKYYASVFDGSDLQMMPYSAGPGAPADWADSTRIMHGQLTIGDGTFMASDYPPGVAGDPQKGFSVMQAAPDLAAARTWFDALAREGDVIDAFKETFFSPGFGMVRDKFGTHWIISTVPPAQG
jgi:PhnB protein